MQALTHNLLEKVFAKMDHSKSNKSVMTKLSLVCKRFTEYVAENYWDTDEVKDIKRMLKKRDSLIISKHYGYFLREIEDEIKEAIYKLKLSAPKFVYKKFEAYVFRLFENNCSFSKTQLFSEPPSEYEIEDAYDNGDYSIYGGYMESPFHRFNPQSYYGIALPEWVDDLNEIFENTNFKVSFTSYAISCVYHNFVFFEYFYKYVKHADIFENLFYESERDKAAEFIAELEKTGRPLDSHAKYIYKGYRNNGIDYFDHDDYETDQYSYESTKRREVSDEFPELTYEFQLADDELDRIFADEVY